MENFEEALARVLNQFSMEDGSDTPDFVLAQFLTGCLSAFDQAVQQRRAWYGKNPASAACAEQEAEDAE